MPKLSDIIKSPYGKLTMTPQRGAEALIGLWR